MTLKIKPSPNCKYCHGQGEVFDTVDYGSTTAQMSSLCDCVLDQIPLDCSDDVPIEVEPVIQCIHTVEKNGNVYKQYSYLWDDKQ